VDLKTKAEIDKFWNFLKECDAKHYTMVCTTPEENDEKKAKGIVSYHCYSLIKVIEFEHNGS